MAGQGAILSDAQDVGLTMEAFTTATVVGARNRITAIGSDYLDLSGTMNTVAAGDNFRENDRGGNDSLVAGAYAVVNIAGNNVSATVGDGSYVGVVSGVGVQINENHSTTFKQNNVSVSVNGSFNQLHDGANSSFWINGASNSFTEGNGSFAALQGDGNVATAATGGGFNIAGNNNTVTVTDGAYVGVVSGVGSTINANNGTIVTLNAVAATINGSGEHVSAGADTSLIVNGDMNSVTTAGGGAAVFFGSGNAAAISNATVSAAGGSLSIAGSFNVVNAVGGSDVGVSGGSNTVNVSVGSLATITGTGTGADTIMANGVNGQSYTADGKAAGVVLGDGTVATIVGSNNDLTIGNGNDVKAFGGSNVIHAGVNNAIEVGQTNGAVTYIFGSNNVLTGTTADGRTSDITVDANAQTNIIGSSNTISLASGVSLGAFGGDNGIFSQSNDLVYLGATGSKGDWIVAQGTANSGVTADGKVGGIVLTGGVNANVLGNGNTFSLTSGNTLNLLAGSSNNVVNVSGINDVVNPAGNGGLVVNGNAANQAQLNWSLAHSSAMAVAIDHIYGEILGRGADSPGLAAWEDQVGNGLSLAGLRLQIASSAEARSDLGATYASFNDSPTPTETTAFVELLSTSANQSITVYGHDGILASTDANALLAELPVLETLNNGRTLSLGLPDGSNIKLADTSRLADLLFAVSVQRSTATTLTQQVFNEDRAWLVGVDQPMLDVSAHFSDIAAAYTAQGNTARAILANTAAHVALQIAAMPPGQRVAITDRVNLPDHKTDVTLYPNTADPFATAQFHDIDPGIGGVLEAVGLAVLNIVAAIFPETGLPYVAATADAAVAGQDFANGQVLQGILQLASAAGQFSIGLGATNAVAGATQTGQVIQTAVQGVGGVYGAVQGAEHGDALGVLAGVLEATAAVASGVAQGTDGTTSALASRVRDGLNIAATVTTTAAAFNNGDLATGLINSLGYILTDVAGDYNAQKAAVTDAVSAAQITQSVASDAKIAFVGGFFDSLLNGPMHRAYQKYIDNPANEKNLGNVQYFTYDQSSAISAFSNQSNGNVTLIGHSYGADTIANLVGNGLHVQHLITLDPVGYVQPNFASVHQNAGFWENYNATGGQGLEFSNAVAGVGSSYNLAPQSYADVFKNISVSHGVIGGPDVVNRLLGS